MAVNEHDEIGSDLVPDYMTSVRDGGFYGWPYSYYGQHIALAVAESFETAKAAADPGPWKEFTNTCLAGDEIDDEGVLASIGNGVNVIQSDLESGLAGFDDQSTPERKLAAAVKRQDVHRHGKGGGERFANFSDCSR